MLAIMGIVRYSPLLNICSGPPESGGPFFLSHNIIYFYKFMIDILGSCLICI